MIDWLPWYVFLSMYLVGLWGTFFLCLLFTWGYHLTKSICLSQRQIFGNCLSVLERNLWLFVFLVPFLWRKMERIAQLILFNPKSNTWCQRLHLHKQYVTWCIAVKRKMPRKWFNNLVVKSLNVAAVELSAKTLHRPLLTEPLNYFREVAVMLTVFVTNLCKPVLLTTVTSVMCTPNRWSTMPVSRTYLVIFFGQCWSFFSCVYILSQILW